MTQTFEKQLFESWYDRGGHLYENVEFRRCQFVSSCVSVVRDPQRRSTVRKCRLVNCEVTGCALETAIVEDVLVDGLKTHNLLACWGTVFKHTTLKGRIGRVMINPVIATGMATPAEQAAFDAANAAYYAAADWALDISEAEFVEADIRGIPARLIRRDPETQVVVTRRQAAEGAWRDLDLSRTWWATSLEFFLNRNGEDDIVLVAPKRHRQFKELLDGLKALRDAGVAEPA